MGKLGLRVSSIDSKIRVERVAHQYDGTTLENMLSNYCDFCDKFMKYVSRKLCVRGGW